MLSKIFQFIKEKYNADETDIILVEYEPFYKAMQSEEAAFVFDDMGDYQQLI